MNGLPLNEIIHGDCLEVMRQFPDKSIDMILCDLPYGTTACKWDTVIPFEPLWEQYNRIIKKHGAIVLFGIEPFASNLRMSNIKNYKHEWVWNKEQAGNFIQAKNHPLRVTENIMVFCNEKVRYYPIMEKAKEENKRPLSVKLQKTNFLGKVSQGEFKPSENYNPDLRYPKNILTFNAGSKECNNVNRVHPAQKPVALFEYLIKTYTLPGEVVLDNCIGSGTTAIACINTGRNFIGIEIDEKYVKIARERIEKHKKLDKMRLFPISELETGKLQYKGLFELEDEE